VKPEHILGILGVETTWGRNTGKFPIVRTLEEISTRTDSKGRRTRAAIQAENDLKALARLSAEGNLGGLKPSELRSSYAGAMGVPQFLPTSWEAYSRAPDGGKRDPFNFGTAAYSVGNYLKVHGYNKDVPRSIWGYNHSQEYVDKVLDLSADVKASLNAAAPPVK
jgi:membrane-bound lytic murein transglycosylase B